MPKKVPTYEELTAREDKVFVAEHEGFLYIALPAREYYDNAVWKVNKETHEVTPMLLAMYLGTIDPKATYIYTASEWVQ